MKPSTQAKTLNKNDANLRAGASGKYCAALDASPLFPDRELSTVYGAFVPALHADLCRLASSR